MLGPGAFSPMFTGISGMDMGGGGGSPGLSNMDVSMQMPQQAPVYNIPAPAPAPQQPQPDPLAELIAQQKQKEQANAIAGIAGGLGGMGIGLLGTFLRNRNESVKGSQAANIANMRGARF